jgi:hypothetical protein
MDDDTPELLDHRDFLRRFKSRPTSTAPSPWGIGFLIEQVGTGFEILAAGIERLETLIMTSAQNTDQVLQAIAADLQTVAANIQTAETTLSNDLATAVADIQDVVNNGGTVQASTLTSLQNVQTALDGLAAPLTTAVGQLDAAVNPPAPAPAPAPSPAPSGN